ncbi:MAG: sugar phosphate isomerase/epimerase [Kiritimatiellae bacterium]|nr:sugar phosphate isomerase/epimerase [Kiritimatiellia bacterium]
MPDPGPALLDDIARAGIRHVEISLDGRKYAGFDFAAFAAHARDAGVDVRSFHLPFYTDETVDPASLDEAVRRRTAEIHAHYVRVAASMGAKIAVVHACLEPVADADRAERIARSKESMAALADVGEAEGVTVCVENLPRSCLGNTSAELADIVACDDRLRVCFDVNHLLLDTHAEFLRVNGAKIAATHVSDYDFVNERHWLPGEGRIDWAALADGLDAIGYRGTFNYEISFRGNPKTVRRARDLVPADVARNAAEIMARKPLTVIGEGGIEGLPPWP